MRIDVGTVYVLENGELAYIHRFHAGDEHIPAHYQGSIEGNCLANWRPDGMHIDSVDEWNIYRKASAEYKMVVHTQVG